MYDYAVVGSGIGGSSIAAYLASKGKKVALFEKEPYLGGCSSSFTRCGYTYNTGATTLAGYEDGMVVKEFFDTLGYKPNLIKTDPAIVVLHNNKTTHRYKDVERFLKDIKINYPHAMHDDFWHLVATLNESFYKQKGHYYSNKNLLKKMVSLVSFMPLFMKFSKYLFKNALDVIDNFYGGISDEYKEFLEAQVVIVTQAPLKEINFFTAALALAYTFNDNYYALGGFSRVFDGMCENMSDVFRKKPITKIIKHHGMYQLYTHERVYEAKNVILNTTMYDTPKLFEDEEITRFYKKYEKLDNHQSSFMLYATIKTDKKLHHHYQLIQKEIINKTLSKALFVSFSDQEDNEIAPEGYYSMSASIHTDTRFWDADKEVYSRQKEQLQAILLEIIMRSFEFNADEVIKYFSATPKTFARYIGRSQLGGNAMSMKNLLPLLPSNDTPFEGLYHVGDSVYAAQGWPGVMFGVKNLTKLLDV